MAVTPVDISMMQRMDNVAQMRHNEMTRPQVEQNVITQNIEHHAMENTRQVVRKNETDKSNDEHDARQKGKNSYFGDGGSKRNKKDSIGRVMLKEQESFDIKI